MVELIEINSKQILLGYNMELSHKSNLITILPQRESKTNYKYVKKSKHPPISAAKNHSPDAPLHSYIWFPL